MPPLHNSRVRAYEDDELLHSGYSEAGSCSLGLAAARCAFLHILMKLIPSTLLAIDIALPFMLNTDLPYVEHDAHLMLGMLGALLFTFLLSGFVIFTQPDTMSVGNMIRDCFGASWIGIINMGIYIGNHCPGSDKHISIICFSFTIWSFFLYLGLYEMNAWARERANFGLFVV